MTEKQHRFFLQRTKQFFSTFAVIAILVSASVVTLMNMVTLWSNATSVESTYEYLIAIESLESALKDAETGQRDYIITGNPSYLKSYDDANQALDMLLIELEKTTRESKVTSELLVALNDSIDQKRIELKRVLELRDRSGFEAARDVVKTDAGKQTMDEFRGTIRKIRDLEVKRLGELKQEFNQTYNSARYMVLLSSIAGIALVIGVLQTIRRRSVTAERDAAIISEERQRLEKAINDRQLFERRSHQLDQHIRLFVDQIQDYAIFTIDNDYRATSWNKGVAKVLGFDEAEFIGQDIRPLIFTPESNASGATANEFHVAVESGSASDDRWMMRNGQVRFWASGITSSIRDEHDQLIGFSKVMRDMTMQKQSGDELSRLASELSEESRRKNEFLATLAHELRNPLSPIKNAIQLMELMHVDGEVNELRLTMARQVEQLVRLIDDLMDVSRIGRGKLELKRQSVHLDSIVRAAVEASQPLIETNHQVLEVHLDEPEMVMDVDPARMTQVLCNLLNNASKYSDAQCRIGLSVNRVNGSVVFRVKDNGSGIAPDRLDTIFDMYSQLGESVERGSAGLGIGLALVRTLIELHGGTITAHSEGEGKGSEFVILIPCESHSAITYGGGVPAVADFPERSYRVLVVEDMRALAVVLARLLSKMGHHVEMVENGEAAIEKLKHFDAEVIFSDISMPMMTGYELARYLRSQEATSTIKLVAMTGYGQLSDREKAYAAGFDEHMTKPVDINRLREFFVKLSSPETP